MMRVLNPIGNQTVDELATLSFTATATDSDLPADTLTFSLDAASIAAGMTITAGGDFSWTPTEAQGGTAPSVTITVTDSGTGNLIDSETFTITVNDINTAPVLDPIGDQTVDELATLSFTATATDSDLPADTLTFSLDAVSIAAGMTITVGGDFSWTPTEAQGGTAPSVTITVTDSGTGNLVDSETFTITVREINLSLGPIYDLNPAPETISENAGSGSAVGITAHAVDPDITETVSYSLTNDFGGLFTIDSNTGVVSLAGELDYESATSHTITVRATSTDGGFSELNFIVQVTDIDEGGSDENIEPPVDEETTPAVDPEETVSVVNPEEIDPIVVTIETVPVVVVEEEVQFIEVAGEEPGGSPVIPVMDFEPYITENTEESDDNSEEDKTVTSSDPDSENTSRDSTTAQQDGILLSPDNPNYVQLAPQEKASTSGVKPVLKQTAGDVLFKVLRLPAQADMDFTDTSAAEMPIYQGSSDLDGIVKENVTMRTQITAMHQDIDAAFEKAEEEHKVVVYMASGATASFAVGAASYLLRAGSLMSSFLATVPIWKGFDPVAILIAPKKEKKKDEEQPAIDTDQLAEKMFETKETQ